MAAFQKAANKVSTGCKVVLRTRQRRLTIYPCHVSTALHSDTNVHSLELLLSQQQQGLLQLQRRKCSLSENRQVLRLQRKPWNLVSQGGRLHKMKREAVHFDQAVAFLAVRHCRRRFLGVE